MLLIIIVCANFYFSELCDSFLIVSIENDVSELERHAQSIRWE
jgi:hypothetical protein